MFQPATPDTGANGSGRLAPQRATDAPGWSNIHTFDLEHQQEVLYVY